MSLNQKDRFSAVLFDLLLLGVFFDFDYFTALIMPAFRADGMWQSHLTTVAALDEVVGYQSVLRTPAIAAAFRKFAFWLRNHALLLSRVPEDQMILNHCI
jgi:hypothetical protein